MNLSETNHSKKIGFKKGYIPWNKGQTKYKNHGCLTCSKVFIPEKYHRKVAKFCSLLCYWKNMKGKPHGHKTANGVVPWNWKGADVGYNALHSWVKRKLGKAKKCSNDSSHIASYYHWANISGKYKRDLNDWHELCPSCNCWDGIRKAPRFLRGGVFT